MYKYKIHTLYIPLDISMPSYTPPNHRAAGFQQRPRATCQSVGNCWNAVQPEQMPALWRGQIWRLILWLKSGEKTTWDGAETL